MKKNFAHIVMLSAMVAEKDSVSPANHFFEFVRKNADGNGSGNRLTRQNLFCGQKRV
jgi:hypothetical protein